MATETVTDYLGHPCEFIEAQDAYTESIREAQKLKPLEIRRQIGRGLLALRDRMGHTPVALQMMTRALPNSTDSDGVGALLAMAIPYEVQTCNEYFDFAGLVLTALGCGTQCAEEADHG